MVQPDTDGARRRVVCTARAAAAAAGPGTELGSRPTSGTYVVGVRNLAGVSRGTGRAAEVAIPMPVGSSGDVAVRMQVDKFGPRRPWAGTLQASHKTDPQSVRRPQH